MAKKILSFIGIALLITSMIFAIINFSNHSKYNNIQIELSNSEISLIDKFSKIDEANHCKDNIISMSIWTGIFLCAGAPSIIVAMFLPGESVEKSKSKIK